MRLVLVLVLLVRGLLAPSATPAVAQEFVIGVAAPMTGNLAEIGRQFAEAAQLAAREVNARGGVRGRKVALRIEDDKGDPKDAATVARKLAADDRVLAILGHSSSSACLAAIPLYTTARLAAITPSASQTDLTTRGGKYLFRMWSPISVYAPNLARYTVQRIGRRKVGVVYVQDDWGIQTKERYVTEVERLGAKVMATAVVHARDTDFRAPLARMKAANPDVLAILTSYTTGAIVVQQARTLGLTAAIVGTDTLYEDKLLEIAGFGNAEGLAVNTEFSPEEPVPAVAAFVASYRNLHPGETPRPYHATTYDAARVVFAAIEQAGTDREAIRDAIASTRDFPGVTGTFSFSDDRERVPHGLAYFVVKDGKWAFIGRHGQ